MSEKNLASKIQNKKAAKEFLRNEYGISLNKKKMLLSVFIDEKTSLEEFSRFLDSLLEAIKAVSISVLILAPKSMAKELNKFRSPRGVSVLSLDQRARNKALEASDVSFIFPLTSMNGRVVKEMWRHGIVPITSEKKFQSVNYDPNKETGCSFFVPKNDIWNVFAALVRASETYRFPYDWRHIVRQALEA